MIFLDTRSGYHQIRVRRSDKNKLALFNPSGIKETFKVIPFSPKNTPDFYTVMMQPLRKVWFLLFTDMKHIITIYPDPVTIICNYNIIIDENFLYSNHVPTLLHYFSCAAQVFSKYRLSFKLTKCDFLKPRVVFVEHDLTTYGNFPAEFKFELITN